MPPTLEETDKLIEADRLAREKFEKEQAERQKVLAAQLEADRVAKEKADAKKAAEDEKAAAKAAAEKLARINGNPAAHALAEVAAALRGKGGEQHIRDAFSAAADQLDAKAWQIASAGHGHPER